MIVKVVPFIEERDEYCPYRNRPNTSGSVVESIKVVNTVLLGCNLPQRSWLAIALMQRVTHRGQL